MGKRKLIIKKKEGPADWDRTGRNAAAMLGGHLPVSREKGYLSQEARPSPGVTAVRLSLSGGDGPALPAPALWDSGEGERVIAPEPW